MIVPLSLADNRIITYRRNYKTKLKHSETLLAMSYEQWETSRKLLKKSSKLVAHFANFARNYFVGMIKFCTFAFVNWNQIKKGGNGKQNYYYLDLVILQRHIKAFLLILRRTKSGKFHTNQSIDKLKTLTMILRGLFLFDWLGIPEPRTSVRKKFHDFFMLFLNIK